MTDTTRRVREAGDGGVGPAAVRRLVAERFLRPAQAFVATETAGGAFVLVAAVVAFAWANSPWKESYFDLWASPVRVDTGLFSLDKTVGKLVNDGLMAIFFFVVGLEIKRELLHGELASVRKAALPVAAALGGMAVPALIFTAFNAGGEGSRGWGIPMATDIAFALGVLGLLGRRAPFSLKVFLLALAVVDDLGAILVIAIFYTESISLDASLAAVGMLAFIFLMRAVGIRSIDMYVIAGAVFWLAVLKSGVHATIAGVVLALLTPARADASVETFEEEARSLLDRVGRTPDSDDEGEQTLLHEFELAVRRSEAPLERLERQLHPWVSFVIVPLFALANAGLEVSGDSVRAAAGSAVTGGVFFGLVLGKPLGVLLFAWLAVRAGLAALPGGVTWRHITGAGLLAGIGFTVSLFVTGLAFDAAALEDEAKMGILVASLLSGAAGLAFLRSAPAIPEAEAGARAARH